MVDEAGIQLRYEALDPVLDERSRRRFAAAEAWAAGRGGVAVVSRITGVARSTINRGLAELRDDTSRDVVTRRVRRPGGGRKRLTDIDATLLSDLGVTARFVQNCTLRPFQKGLAVGNGLKEGFEREKPSVLRWASSLSQTTVCECGCKR